jgi:hypothetical protein
VERQLDLFSVDESQLLAEAGVADAAWTNASADASEELYGDFQLVADAVGERLYDMREAFARTLQSRDVDEYRSAFDTAARKRYGVLASFLEGGD